MDASNALAQYLEGLIHRHLRHVRFPRDRPPAIPPQWDEVHRLFTLEVMIAGLEQDGDVILSRLLRAAVTVSQTAVGGLATRLEEFLQLSVNYIPGVRTQEGVMFLQTVLEDLMRKESEREDEGENEDEDREERDEETNMVSDNSSDESDDDWRLHGTEIAVLVGDDSFPVAFTNILSCFWAERPDRRLETACHACGEPFVEEPPIRTISILNDSPSIHVRVFNRHFSCIKTRGIFFVPISHVWDDSIREANEARAHNDAAACKLLATLEALFQGAEDAYDAGVEFWHDYFSVPQWDLEIKYQLLQYLPAIYHLADEILIHMDDMPGGYVSLLLLGASTITSDDPLLTAVGKIPLVRAVCGSDWMTRMWVALEYAQCRAACVMDGANHIHRFRDYGNPNPIVDLFARDTFSRIVNGAQTQLLEFFRCSKSFAISLSQPGEFLSGIAGSQQETVAERRRLSLGQAVELVARKGCQYSRDRLVALDVLLDGQRTTWVPTNAHCLPRAEAEACAHVWRKGLRQGDYSPLLLQPIECVAGSNPTAQSGLPSWIVGHAGLQGAEWACGNQRVLPRFPPLAVDENIIRVKLQPVGRIEEVQYLEAEMSGEVGGVAWAIARLDEIARAEGIALAPETLVDGLNRVFPFDENHKLMARQTVNMVFSFDELRERDPEFEDEMRELLAEYQRAADDSDREEVARQISDALELETHIAADLSNKVTRLTRSRHIARNRKSRGAHEGAMDGEPVCKVRCMGCRTVTLFRLDLRDTGGAGQTVYRIPGLSYSESVEDGVGLVISGDRITGRMLYGPPACNCDQLDVVEIV